MSNGRKKSSNPCPEINIALVGELGSGKSALTVKYITKRFIVEYAPFIEDTYVKHDVIGQQDITVHVMDTFDKPDSDPQRYLRWADAMLVVYSITDRASFEKARAYCEVILQYCKTTTRDIPVAVVANKIDLEINREVSKEAGLQLAADFDCVFYETTAAEEPEYVDCIFHGIIQDYMRDRDILQLFIGDDRGTSGYGGLLVPPQQNASFSLLRAKSPKPSDKKDDKQVARKTSTTSFKLFNKSFKIFN